MTQTILAPIVGAHFRPPAKAFIQTLPVGQILWLRPEPTNPYDENAVKVLVLRDELPADEEFWADLVALAIGQGYDRDALEAEPEWHLGYIPKTLAEELAGHIPGDSPGTFGLSADGKPTIEFHIH